METSPRKERRITILFVSTAIISSLIGSFFGTLWMFYLSSNSKFSSLILSHPYFQMFGFLAEFVMGVAYSLLPRFAGKALSNLYLAYLNYFLITSALFLSVVSILFDGQGKLYFSSLLVGSSAIFTYQTFSTTKQIKSAFPEANLLFKVSSSSLLTFAFLYFLSNFSINFDPFSEQSLLLFLLGFVGSIIYAVEIRSVAFRQANYRKRLTTIAGLTQVAALVFLVVGMLDSVFALLGKILLLATSIEVLLAIRLLTHSLMYTPAMTGIHLRIKRYNEVSLTFAFFWLFSGLVISLLHSIDPAYFLRDMFIHTVAIGFVGSTIVCFSPMYIPGIISARGPISGLSFGPIITLAIAVLIRIVGDIEALSSGNFAIWEWISGVFVLVSVVWLLAMLRSIIVAKNIQHSTVKEHSDTTVSAAEFGIRVSSESSLYLHPTSTANLLFCTFRSGKISH